MRNRLWLAVGVAIVIAVGLASRRFPSLVPAFLGKYPGDSLWALMVFLGWGLLEPRLDHALGRGRLARFVRVEISQLYRAPWLDAVRDIHASSAERMCTSRNDARGVLPVGG